MVPLSTKVIPASTLGTMLETLSDGIIRHVSLSVFGAVSATSSHARVMIVRKSGAGQTQYIPLCNGFISCVQSSPNFYWVENLSWNGKLKVFDTDYLEVKVNNQSAAAFTVGLTAR